MRVTDLVVRNERIFTIRHSDGRLFTFGCPSAHAARRRLAALKSIPPRAIARLWTLDPTEVVIQEIA